jgi:hypothetical protein
VAILKTIRDFVWNYRLAIVAWVVIVVVVFVGLHLGLDKRVVAGVAILIGLIGHAFAALLLWIGLVPVVGPILVGVLSLPFIWVINGVGYLVSYIAIKQGYPKEILNYRVLTITLLLGIIIGYVLGKVV